MTDYMNIEEQLDADFSRARTRAFLRRVTNGFRKGSGAAPSFDDVRKALGAFNQVPAPTKTVEVGQIVGSVGRRQDFDACFLPIRSNAASRWERVDRAFHRGVVLPPVSLYQIGSRYFVLDGNHRVSVARYHGVETIDAEVVEFHPRKPSAVLLPDLPPNCSRWLSRLNGWLKSTLSLRARSGPRSAT